MFFQNASGREAEKSFLEFCFAKLPRPNGFAIWPAQGIEAVSFFAAGEKDTSG
jgi:hypothetical protein